MKRENEARLQFCRDIGVCIVTGLQCRVDPAHTRYSDALFGKDDSGISLKPFDAFTLPLSRPAHESQHGMGEREWWTSKGFRAGSIIEGPLAAGLIITGFFEIGSLDQATIWTIERAKLSLAYQRNVELLKIQSK